jgi:hypothetical protein
MSREHHAGSIPSLTMSPWLSSALGNPNMLILSSPICPRCEKSVMTRQFSGFDYFGMVLFVVLFFPVTIWIYLTPRHLHCHMCGLELSERPS